MNHYFPLPALLVLFSLFIHSSAHSATQQLTWIGHWKNEDKREKLVNEVKKEFEFLYPEVEITLRYNVDLDAPGENYKWKSAHTITEMIRTGNIKWDVVFLDVIVYKHVAELLDDPYWGEKHLIDFSNIPRYLQSQKEFIRSDPTYKKQTGGIFTGPHIEGLFYCFWYNKKVAEQTGITIQQRKMRVEDLLDYARQLAEYNKTNSTTIPLIQMGTWNRLDTLFEYLFKSQFDTYAEAIAPAFNKSKEKAFLDTLLIFEQLSRYQPILNSDRKTLHWDEWKEGFLDNKGLFITAGSFMYNHLQASGPENYKKAVPVEYPVAKQANGLVGLYTPIFAVMKKSRNKTAAINLLMLWTEPKIAEKWVNYTRNPTGIQGHLNEPITKSLATDVYSRFVLEMTEEYSHQPMRYFQQPFYVFGEDNPVSASEFRENLALILEGRKTAVEYFNNIMHRFKQQQQ